MPLSAHALRGTRAAVSLAAAALMLAALSGSADSATGVKVWFLQGEQVISVDRPGSTADDAVRQLLAGPTAAEMARGIRTYVPAGTPVRSVTVANGVVTVDLGETFVAGNDAPSLLARLSQLVYTASGPQSTAKVRLLVKGGTPLGLFPGVVTAVPLTVSYLQTPNVKAPVPPPEKPAPVSSSTRSAQQRLAALGYLAPSEVDGQLGPSTESAVLAFQKWEGLARDGVLGRATLKRLATATRPVPMARKGAGRRAEVLLDRQVALAIDNDRLVRVIHVSTGAPTTPTPPGRLKVYAKIAKWWSVPFREWLLWAVPFNGGIAFHELADVPAVPASHGCVRERFVNSKWMYGFSRVGMPVDVLATSR
jgi:Putative peptidoglycan binding domain/Sporulation and spore germination/L,D-transpeptidase catalytic domain